MRTRSSCKKNPSASISGVGMGDTLSIIIDY
jgi:hypothetical protein